MNKWILTELKELKELNSILKLNNKVYAKIENTNPSGSIKDRAVYYMLNDYRLKGLLKKGTTVIEATSGNTGISLSYFSKEFEIDVIIVMPKSMSKERREMISHYGAKLVLVDGGMKESKEEALRINRTIKDSIILNQFNNQANIVAHYETTAEELDNQLENIDYIFSGIGTGGTISGISKYFKEKNKNIKIIGIEPEESPLITKGFASSHKIQGIGANFIPPILRLDLIDDVTTVKSEDAIKYSKLIREKEMLDIGISSGAALVGAINYLKNKNIKNKNIVVIFPDKGDRYSW